MRHNEDALQVLVADYLRATKPRCVWYHCPNGGKRNIKEASRFKKMGVLPGVPDLCFVLPDSTAAFIELKVKGGSQTDYQKKFESDVSKFGCKYVVCFSLEEVQKTLKEWLS